MMSAELSTMAVGYGAIVDHVGSAGTPAFTRWPVPACWPAREAGVNRSSSEKVHQPQRRTVRGEELGRAALLDQVHAGRGGADVLDRHRLRGGAAQHLRGLERARGDGQLAGFQREVGLRRAVCGHVDGLAACLVVALATVNAWDPVSKENIQ
jgi:hypothetical protein